MAGPRWPACFRSRQGTGRGRRLAGSGGLPWPGRKSYPADRAGRRDPRSSAGTGGHFVEEDRVVGDQVVTLKKRLAPEILAQTYWLKNRQPKHWHDRVEVKEEVNLNVFPPKEVLDAMYERTMAIAKERDAFLIGRRERLGIPVDSVEGD